MRASIDAALVTTRLGSGLVPGGRLDPAARARTRDAVVGLAARARAAGATRVVGVRHRRGTPRRDGRDFATELASAAGCPVEVLSGDDEAALAYAAVRHACGEQDRRAPGRRHRGRDDRADARPRRARRRDREPPARRARAHGVARATAADAVARAIRGDAAVLARARARRGASSWPPAAPRRRSPRSISGCERTTRSGCTVTRSRSTGSPASRAPPPPTCLACSTRAARASCRRARWSWRSSRARRAPRRCA